MVVDGYANYEILLDCLDMWDAGVAVEKILSRYPTRVDELRPMLDLLPHLSSFALTPSKEAQVVSRTKFLLLAISDYCPN